MFSLTNKKILLTGGAGFLGSYVKKKLVANGASEKKIIIPRKLEYDLRDFNNCLKITKDIDLLIHLAANVGGISYNMKYPADLFYDNAIMGINIIEASRINNVKKILLTGTVCSYPKHTPVPFRESDLWEGFPEETNAPYGIAKKVLLTQAQTYNKQYEMNIIYLIPVNLYGPGDQFELEKSHVIPALIKKFVDAMNNNLPNVEVWGTGEVSREFLFVEDAATGIVKAAINYNKPYPVNLGTGTEIKIRDLAYLIKELVGYKGELSWNKYKPDGQPRRMLDISRAKNEFGFEAQTELSEGIKKTLGWYIKNFM